MTASSLRALLRRCHQPAILYLSVLPLLFYAVCRFWPDAQTASWLLLSASFLLCALCIAMPGRLRRIAAAVCAALLIALGAVLLPLRAHLSLFLLPAASAALLLFALPLAGRALDDTPPPFYFFGLAAYLIAHIIPRFDRFEVRMRVSALAPVLLAALIAYLLLLFLSLNRISLDNATMARCRLPASMRRTNTLLSLAFLAAAVLLAALPWFVRLMKTACSLALHAVRAVFSLLARLLPDAPGVSGGFGGAMPPQLIPAAAAEESSFLALLLDRLMVAVTYLILIVGTLLILRFLLRLFLRVLRAAAARLARYGAAVSEDYTDEITDTREDGVRSFSFSSQVRRRFSSAPAPGEPGAHIRWRYARLLIKNSRWSGSATARENLPEEAAALYERARYSDLPVSAEDAARFDEHTRKL